MLYQLYIYKSKATTSTAPAIGMCNSAVLLGTYDEWKHTGAANLMDNFDVHIISAKIKTLLKDNCKVIIKTAPAPYDYINYLHVVTSYEKAASVLPYLHCITAENDLLLYDVENNKSFYKDLINHALISAKIRLADYKNAIRKNMQPLWKIQNIGNDITERGHQYHYVVTVRKDSAKNFRMRCEEFYQCLKNTLSETEELLNTHQCFIIKGQDYSISFSLEGYKKHAQQIGFYQGGLPKIKPIRRMGCDEAFRWIEKHNINFDSVLERMNFTEMVRAYPNPADRFVASVNISKWEKNNPFMIRYKGIGEYGSKILFHIVPDWFYDDGRKISVLAIEEESATFLLPFINEVYDFYARYYMEENHVSTQTWGKILSRLEEAKEMIINDTFNQKLLPHIEKFNLFVLATPDDRRLIGYDKQEFLYLHRYDVGKLIDIFIKWSKAQLKYYDFDGEGRMFNIQGP